MLAATSQLLDNSWPLPNKHVIDNRPAVPWEILLELPGGILIYFANQFSSVNCISLTSSQKHFQMLIQRHYISHQRRLCYWRVHLHRVCTATTLRAAFSGVIFIDWKWIPILCCVSGNCDTRAMWFSSCLTWNTCSTRLVSLVFSWCMQCLVFCWWVWGKLRF